MFHKITSPAELSEQTLTLYLSTGINAHMDEDICL